MDFHSMKRKELQALCKKNKIPANITNLEMANKLTLLLKEKEKPVTRRRRSCLKNTEEIADENHNSDIVARQAKKVKFSPEHEIIIFGDDPVGITRSRAQKSEEGSEIPLISPPPQRKRTRKVVGVHGMEVKDGNRDDKTPPETRVPIRKSRRSKEVMGENQKESERKRNAKGIDEIYESNDLPEDDDIGLIKPLRRSKRSVRKVEDSEQLNGELGKCKTVGKGKFTRSQSESVVEMEDSDVERETQTETKVEVGGEELEVVQQLEEPLRRTGRNGNRRKSVIPQNEKVGTNGLKDKNESRKLSGFPETEINGKGRATRSGAQLVLEASGVDTEAKFESKAKVEEESEEGIQFVEISRNPVRNGNRRKSVRWQIEEVGTNGPTAENESTKLSKGSAGEGRSIAEIPERKKEASLSNVSLRRRTRRETLMFKSTNPTNDELGTQETVGGYDSLKQSSAPFVEKEGSAKENVRRSKRNASGHETAETTSTAIGKNKSRKAKRDHIVEEETVATECASLIKEPPRRPRRTAAKGESVMPAVVTGEVVRKKRQSKQKSPNLALESPLTESLSVVQEPPASDAHQSIPEVVGKKQQHKPISPFLELGSPLAKSLPVVQEPPNSVAQLSMPEVVGKKQQFEPISFLELGSSLAESLAVIKEPQTSDDQMSEVVGKKQQCEPVSPFLELGSPLAESFSVIKEPPTSDAQLSMPEVVGTKQQCEPISPFLELGSPLAVSLSAIKEPPTSNARLSMPEVVGKKHHFEPISPFLELGSPLAPNLSVIKEPPTSETQLSMPEVVGTKQQCEPISPFLELGSQLAERISVVKQSPTSDAHWSKPEVAETGPTLSNSQEVSKEVTLEESNRSPLSREVSTRNSDLVESTSVYTEKGAEIYASATEELNISDCTKKDTEISFSESVVVTEKVDILPEVDEEKSCEHYIPEVNDDDMALQSRERSGYRVEKEPEEVLTITNDGFSGITPVADCSSPVYQSHYRANLENILDLGKELETYEKPFADEHIHPSCVTAHEVDSIPKGQNLEEGDGFGGHLAACNRSEGSKLSCENFSEEDEEVSPTRLKEKDMDETEECFSRTQNMVVTSPLTEKNPALSSSKVYEDTKNESACSTKKSSLEKQRSRTEVSFKSPDLVGVGDVSMVKPEGTPALSYLKLESDSVHQKTVCSVKKSLVAEKENILLVVGNASLLQSDFHKGNDYDFASQSEKESVSFDCKSSLEVEPVEDLNEISEGAATNTSLSGDCFSPFHQINHLDKPTNLLSTGEELKAEDSLLYNCSYPRGVSVATDAVGEDNYPSHKEKNLVDCQDVQMFAESSTHERNCGNSSKKASEISPLDISDEGMATMNIIEGNIEEEKYSVEAAELWENLAVSYSAPAKDAEEKVTDVELTSGDCPMRTPLLNPIVALEGHVSQLDNEVTQSIGSASAGSINKDERQQGNGMFNEERIVESLADMEKEHEGASEMERAPQPVNQETSCEGSEGNPCLDGNVLDGLELVEEEYEGSNRICVYVSEEIMEGNVSELPDRERVGRMISEESDSDRIEEVLMPVITPEPSDIVNNESTSFQCVPLKNDEDSGEDGLKLLFATPANNANPSKEESCCRETEMADVSMTEDLIREVRTKRSGQSGHKRRSYTGNALPTSGEEINEEDSNKNVNSENIRVIGSTNSEMDDSIFEDGCVADDNSSSEHTCVNVLEVPVALLIPPIASEERENDIHEDLEEVVERKEFSAEFRSEVAGTDGKCSDDKGTPSYAPEHQACEEMVFSMHMLSTSCDKQDDQETKDVREGIGGDHDVEFDNLATGDEKDEVLSEDEFCGPVDCNEEVSPVNDSAGAGLTETIYEQTKASDDVLTEELIRTTMGREEGRGACSPLDSDEVSLVKNGILLERGQVNSGGLIMHIDEIVREKDLNASDKLTYDIGNEDLGTMPQVDQVGQKMELMVHDVDTSAFLSLNRLSSADCEEVDDSLEAPVDVAETKLQGHESKLGDISSQNIVGITDNNTNIMEENSNAENKEENILDDFDHQLEIEKVQKRGSLSPFNHGENLRVPEGEEMTEVVPDDQFNGTQEFTAMLQPSQEDSQVKDLDIDSMRTSNVSSDSNEGLDVEDNVRTSKEDSKEPLINNEDSQEKIVDSSGSMSKIGDIIIGSSDSNDFMSPGRCDDGDSEFNFESHLFSSWEMNLFSGDNDGDEGEKSCPGDTKTNSSFDNYHMEEKVAEPICEVEVNEEEDVAMTNIKFNKFQLTESGFIEIENSCVSANDLVCIEVANMEGCEQAASVEPRTGGEDKSENISHDGVEDINCLVQDQKIGEIRESIESRVASLELQSSPSIEPAVDRVSATEDAQMQQQPKQLNSMSMTRKNRSLVQSTPKKLISMLDMKENAPSTKREDLGTVKTVKTTSKRRALEDLQKRERH